MTIKSTEEVVTALGGLAATAELLEVQPNCISMMKQRGIPAGHHLKIWLALNSKGIAIDTDAVFGYSLDTLSIAGASKEQSSCT